ncbi:MAG: hypothetical protein Q9191_008182 [Dirinaria sp. TL-2023a]
MGVGVATSVGKNIKDWAGMDGILGLGFRELNSATPWKMATLMYWLEIEKQTPTEDVFTVDFNIKAGARTPTIEIGKIDRSKAAGNLGHVPVNNSTGFWTVDNIAFEVNGVAINHTQSMIFDTGGSGEVTVDLPVAEEYYAQVDSHKTSNTTFSVKCDAALPDLKLYLGNSTASYPGSILKAGYCDGVLVGSGAHNVGAMFFQSHYVVFKYDEPAILYAPFAD